MASTVLLLYDAALTLGREYQYIWCPPKSWVSRVLYVVNRYLALFYNLLIVATIPRLSDTVSIHLLLPADAKLVD